MVECAWQFSTEMSNDAQQIIKWPLGGIVVFPLRTTIQRRKDVGFRYSFISVLSRYAIQRATRYFWQNLVSCTALTRVCTCSVLGILVFLQETTILSAAGDVFGFW